MNPKVYVVLTVLALALASWSYYNSTANYNDLNSRYSALSSSLTQANYANTYLRYDLNQSYAMYNHLLSNYSKTQLIHQGAASNQSVVIWTIPQKVVPHWRIEWELLDTFDNHISINTNVTASAVIVELDNYVNLVQNSHYVAVYNSTGTSFQYDMHLTQGCAAYALVIFNNTNGTMLITPDVTATYAPTPFLTGTCSLP